MKKTLSALIVAFVLLFAFQALALSDKDYRAMMKDSNFAQADKNLNDAWNAAKESLSPKDFAKLKKSQAQWIKKGRDDEVKQLRSVKAGRSLSRTDAYAAVTDDRAQYIRSLIQIDAESDPYGDFEYSVRAIADEIMKGEPTFTDGDSRIWKGDKYIVAQAGEYLSEFFTADSSMTFAGRFKIGSSESDLLKFFGGDIRKDDLNTYSAGGIHQWTVFTMENGKIKTIQCTQADIDMTNKAEKKFIDYLSALQN